MRPLTQSERFLAALFVDVLAIAAFLVLCLADKINATTAATVIAGIVLARKPPVDVDDDDDDPPTQRRRKQRKGLSAVSGLLTMCVPLLWAFDRLRARTA